MMPSTELQVPYSRLDASTSNAQFGNYIAAVDVAAGGIGGFFSSPLTVPRDYDRSRDGFIDVIIGKGAGIAPLADQDVVLALALTIIDPGFAIQNIDANTVFTIPASSPNGSYFQVPLGAGGIAIPAGTIPDRSIFGWRIRRDGPNAADTYTISLRLSTTTILRYNRLCRHCDGC